MSKKQEIIDYLQSQHRGETVRVRWLVFELCEQAHITVSKGTIRTALAQMRADGNADMWGGGQSISWYIRKKSR